MNTNIPQRRRSARPRRFFLLAVCLCLAGLAHYAPKAFAALGLPSIEALGGIEEINDRLSAAGIDPSSLSTDDLSRLDDMIADTGTTTLPQFDTLATNINNLNPTDMSELFDLTEELNVTSAAGLAEIKSTLDNLNTNDLVGLTELSERFDIGSTNNLISIITPLQGTNITDLGSVEVLADKLNISDLTDFGDMTQTLALNRIQDLEEISNLTDKLNIGSLGELTDLSGIIGDVGISDISGLGDLAEKFNIFSVDDLPSLTDTLKVGNVTDLTGLKDISDQLNVNDTGGLAELTSKFQNIDLSGFGDLSNVIDKLGISSLGDMDSLFDTIDLNFIPDLGSLSSLVDKLDIGSLGQLGEFKDIMGDINLSELGNLENLVDNLGIQDLTEFGTLTESLADINLTNFDGLGDLADTLGVDLGEIGELADLIKNNGLENIDFSDLSGLADTLNIDLNNFGELADVVGNLDLENIDLGDFSSLADTLGVDITQIGDLAGMLEQYDLENLDLSSLEGLADTLGVDIANFDQFADMLGDFDLENLDIEGLSNLADTLGVDFENFGDLTNMLGDYNLDDLNFNDLSGILDTAGIGSLEDFANLDLSDIGSIGDFADVVGVDMDNITSVTEYNDSSSNNDTRDSNSIANVTCFAGVLPCVGCMDTDCEDAQPRIEDYHVKERPKARIAISNGFAPIWDWLPDVFMQQRFIDVMQNMAHQFTITGWRQVMAYGKLFDAKAQLESQRSMDVMQYEAARAYQPSESFCTIGTNVRSMATNESAGTALTGILNERQMARHLGRDNMAGDATETEDRTHRWNNFVKYYCDPKDNGWNGQVDSGLSAVCQTEIANADEDERHNIDRLNIDIDYTRAVENKRTYEMSGGQWRNTGDEIDIMALGNNLYGHKILSRNYSERALTSTALARRYLALRSVAAKRSVAENSFNTIVGMKGMGSSAIPVPNGETPANANRYLGRILINLGIPAGDIPNYLGIDRVADEDDTAPAHASYYATLEIMAKKIYQDSNFYAGLYDTPENVKRKSAALKAIELMLDREINESQLRQEMAMSVLLSTRLRNYVDEAGTKLGGD